MNEEWRDRLLAAIVAAYSLAQLDTVVYAALKNRLEVYAIAPDLRGVVDKLFDELERRPMDLLRFLERVRTTTPRPELKAAVDGYLRLDDGTGDPYADLVVLGTPMVDRQLLRDKLRQLFGSPYNQVLVTRGPRHAGRSHSRWLVQHVTKNDGSNVVFVDLLDNEVQDVVAQLVNGMNLPPQEFRDRMAQASTQVKGFTSALRGTAQRQFVAAGERWCLVFDHFDRDGVSDEARELVQRLVVDAAGSLLPNVRIIVLGHAGPLPPDISWRVLSEDILPLQAADVERFLQQLSHDTGRPMPDDELCATRDGIFQGLPTPLDADGMYAMADRLRERVRQLTPG